jgi:hypothetical protein
MRQALVVSLLIVWGAGCTLAGQKSKPPAAAPKVTGACPSSGDAALKDVLDSMDRAAKSFNGAEVSFVWDVYQRAANQKDTQRGVMYIRKKKAQIEMAADITDPKEPRRNIRYSGDTVRLYQYKPNGINQITEYKAGSNKATVETFLLLGFGSPSDELCQQFKIRYDGVENVDGKPVSRLELIPQDPGVRRTFDRILLWIDTRRGICVQQQFFEPNSGDYRLVKYTKITPKDKIADTHFKLKTEDKPTVQQLGAPEGPGR